MERLGKLFEGIAVRVQWGGVPTLEFQRDLMGIQAPLIEMHEKFKREGRDFWTASRMCRSPRPSAYSAP